MFNKLFTRLALVGVFLLALLILGLHLAPGLAIHLASSWYAKQGEGYQLEVKNWYFSPFASQLTLEENLNLTQALQVSLTGKLANLWQSPSWQGQVNLADLAVNLPSQNLSFSLAKADLADLKLNPQAASFNQLNLAEISLTQDLTQLDLAKLEATNLQASQEEQRLAELNLTGLSVNQDATYLEIESLAAKELSNQAEKQQLAEVSLVNFQLVDANKLQLNLQTMAANQLSFNSQSQVAKLNKLEFSDLKIKQQEETQELEVYLAGLNLVGIGSQLTEQGNQEFNLHQLQLVNLAPK